MELAEKIAELQFRNRELVLIFRGQAVDRLNSKGNSSLKPSMFRSARDSNANPSPMVLTNRFVQLDRAEREFTESFVRARNLLGVQGMQRHRILRWSILQHYEVCRTPLLDVTHSLRIAASFASQGSGADGYLFVLGVPNISGAVTASAEAGLQVIRLSSVCPPSALRPHLQEGYLLGEYPEIGAIDQKQQYAHYEVDFGRRLVAKFVFRKAKFWSDRDFPLISRTALYPDARDPLFKLASAVRKRVPQVA